MIGTPLPLLNIQLFAGARRRSVESPPPPEAQLEGVQLRQPHALFAQLASDVRDVYFINAIGFGLQHRALLLRSHEVRRNILY